MRLFTRRRQPDAVELDADRLAARALTPIAPTQPAPRLPSPSTAGPPASSRIVAQADALSPSAGAPLERGVRHDMERRFEHDFSQVRVHVADEGARLAEHLGSRAIAIGSQIAFAPHQYRPGDHEGRRLIAHELAHVVQDAGLAAPARVRSKKDPNAKPFYQPELTRFNQAWGREMLALRPFIALCDAIDQDLVGDLPTHLDALEKADVYLFPPNYPSSRTTTAILVRLTLLGQTAPLRRFRTWYFTLPDVGFGKRQQSRRYYDDEIWFWESTLGGLADQVDWSDAARSLVVLDGMLTLVRQVVAERDGLEAGAVKKDAERLKDEGSLTDSRFGLERSPIVSIARYHARLTRLVRDTFVAMQAPYQAALERAIADLAAGKGGRRLEDVAARVTSTLAVVVPLAGPARVEINETVYVTEGRKDALRQVDYFLGGKAALARSVKLTSYDETTATTFPRPTQELEPQRVVAIRANQIAALRRVYGLEKTPGTQQLTADAKENQTALAAVGGNGLQLHDDDDWRKFLLAKFEQHFATSKRADESLDAVVELLKVYLKAFTVHTPMNIDDFGDNLLTQTFPRALTGQLVHDCGVYALRIAYMLSLVREHPSLKLRFRYIQLPVHIGLIITGQGLPAYFIHNDSFLKYDPADLQALRATWDVTDAAGAKRTAPAPKTAANDQQFLAELAGMEFVPNTDLPFVISDVPRLGGTSARADKATLWRTYQVLVRTNELFGPPSHDPNDPSYQFHLRYLEVLEAIKRHHNEFVVPFWNGMAHPAWVRSLPRLRQAERAITAAATPALKQRAERAFDAEVEQYLFKKAPGASFSVRDAFDRVQAAFGPISTKSSAIMLDLQTKPAIVAPRVSRSSGDRLLETFGTFAHPFWARQTLEHFADVRQRTLQPPAPYAEQKNLLAPID